MDIAFGRVTPGLHAAHFPFCQVSLRGCDSRCSSATSDSRRTALERLGLWKGRGGKSTSWQGNGARRQLGLLEEHLLHFAFKFRMYVVLVLACAF